MRAAAPANRSRRRPKRFLWPPLRGVGRRNAFAGAAERSSGRLKRLVGRRTSIGARRTHVVRPAERVGRVRTSVVSPEMSLVSYPVDRLGPDIREGRAEGLLEGARTRGVGRAVVVVRSRERPERPAIATRRAKSLPFHNASSAGRRLARSGRNGEGPRAAMSIPIRELLPSTPQMRTPIAALGGHPAGREHQTLARRAASHWRTENPRNGVAAGSAPLRPTYVPRSICISRANAQSAPVPSAISQPVAYASTNTLMLSNTV
jgi:hypothetical protein